VTISNYTMFLEWDWATNRLRAGNVALLNNGKIRHTWNTANSSPWTPDGGIFIDCSNLTILPGGQINANTFGYAGTTNPANGYGPGAGVYVSGDGAGAGYGGQGGYGYSDSATGGVTYGSTTNPIDIGSSGAGGGLGGSGGGYIRLVVSGSITNDGVIMACATNGTGAAGGGSGGSILIQCGSLAGTGSIRADGGNYGGGGGAGGGGGGGRIAIYASQLAPYGGNMSAAPGGGHPAVHNFPKRGAPYPGTIYLADWSLLPSVLSGGGQGVFAAGGGRAGSLTISNYALFNSGWTDSWLKAGTVTIQSNGVIRHYWNTATNPPWTPNAGVFLDCSNLTILPGGQINADGLGYGGTTNAAGGYGLGGGYSGAGAGGGAGYGGGGGYGGAAGATGGVTYGVESAPVDPGSAGAGTGPYLGGAGGGYIRLLLSGALLMNGTIRAAGTNGAGYAGGGSGGGILIQCGTIAGTGSIQANGANGQGGGGGGRIAIYARNAPVYTTGNLLMTAAPGGGLGGGANTNQNGLVGTIYVEFKPRGTVFQAW
jgi:hypothetical protein